VMLTIRRLVPADAAAHRALMLGAYRDHPEAFTSTLAEREPLPLAWWAARMAEGEAPLELVVGAFDAELLLGAAGLACETRERLRHKATLFGMVVAPAARGRGVGRAIVDAVLDEARRRPALRLVQLTVSEGNAAAEALYRRCGFERFGTEPMATCVAGRFVTKLHLWRPLEAAP
jgi:ribosomal protein S18 acetylase RimI-like enzyme